MNRISKRIFNRDTIPDIIEVLRLVSEGYTSNFYDIFVLSFDSTGAAWIVIEYKDPLTPMDLIPLAEEINSKLSLYGLL